MNVITNETTVSIAFLILVIGFVYQSFNFYQTRKKENVKDAENNIKLNLKLDQICATTAETRTDIKAMNQELKDLQRRVTINEQSLKSLWKQFDHHVEGGNNDNEQ